MVLVDHTGDDAVLGTVTLGLAATPQAGDVLVAVAISNAGTVSSWTGVTWLLSRTFSPASGGQVFIGLYLADGTEDWVGTPITVSADRVGTRVLRSSGLAWGSAAELSNGSFEGSAGFSGTWAFSDVLTGEPDADTIVGGAFYCHDNDNAPAIAWNSLGDWLPLAGPLITGTSATERSAEVFYPSANPAAGDSIFQTISGFATTSHDVYLVAFQPGATPDPIPATSAFELPVRARRVFIRELPFAVSTAQVQE